MSQTAILLEIVTLTASHLTHRRNPLSKLRVPLQLAQTLFTASYFNDTRFTTLSRFFNTIINLRDDNHTRLLYSYDRKKACEPFVLGAYLK